MNGSEGIFINFSVTKHFTNNNCIISGGLLGAFHFDCNWSFRSVQPRVAGHLERKWSMQPHHFKGCSKENDRCNHIASKVVGHFERK